MEKLAKYEYSIKYKHDQKNKNADALSRNPMEKITNEIKNMYITNEMCFIHIQ